ncbi:hypothetical protein PoB_007144100 [Plakobranchus ocellatus]|uniref:Uncharacterized protein n=1 Tax=Plakobranchus ocellatus TaxID=259542 RepID=A0AAV4DLS6_9GAST|nr:hypothetical protein PoB_007144100 [Plakobranchus ocellatus]
MLCNCPLQVTLNWTKKTCEAMTGIKWTPEEVLGMPMAELPSHSYHQVKTKSDDLVDISHNSGLETHPDKTKIRKMKSAMAEQIGISGSPRQQWIASPLQSITDQKEKKIIKAGFNQISTHG